MGSPMDVLWLNGLGASGQHFVLAYLSAAGGLWFFGVLSLAGSLPVARHIEAVRLNPCIQIFPQ